jgi:phosphosulfolactate synthase
MGFNQMSDLLTTSADYIDYMKLGMGIARLLDPDFVREKVSRYREHGLDIFFAGELFELAIMQGVVDQYFRALRDFAVWGVEISNAQVAMGIDEKAELIKRAIDSGLTAVAECGQKGGHDWAESQKYVSRQVEACLAAGAWKVLIQAEGLNEGVERTNTRVIKDLVGEFGLENLIFQAKEPHLPGWFIGEFGARVNLDVDAPSVLDLETHRTGIRKRGVFALVANV